MFIYFYISLREGLASLFSRFIYLDEFIFWKGFFLTITVDTDCLPFCVFNEDANNGIVDPRDDLHLLPLKEEKSRDMQKSYWFCLCHTYYLMSPLQFCASHLCLFSTILFIIEISLLGFIAVCWVLNVENSYNSIFNL